MEFKIVYKWNSFLSQIPANRKDIYYTEEYTKLYETERDTALCIVGHEDSNIILMPFLRRKIGDYYDFETAYGYGGPISNSDSDLWIVTALNGMQEFFKDAGYICGFVRFHPLLGNAFPCNECFNVLYDRKTIAVDMRGTQNDIWTTQISSKNRNMIRKAEKNGLRYKAEYDFKSLSDFKRLYNETMQRLGAEDFYFFPDDYYQNFTYWLRGNAFLGTVILDDIVVGAAMFMTYGDKCHYHLAGSNREKGSLGVNNYLLWKTIEELKKTDVKQFHLGGGTSSSTDDSLFKFKKAFSSQEKDFYIGKWIFNDSVYRDVCFDWEEKYPLIKGKYCNYLLKYRYTK